MPTWNKFGLRARGRQLPLGVVRIAARHGNPAYVEFSTVTAKAWKLRKMRSARFYVSPATPTLVAFQFSEVESAQEDPSTGRVVIKDRRRDDTAVRVYCAALLRQVGVAPGYYVCHREGAWLVTADLAKPLESPA